MKGMTNTHVQTLSYQSHVFAVCLQLLLPAQIEFKKIAACLCGSYIGGSVNFAAVCKVRKCDLQVVVLENRAPVTFVHHGVPLPAPGRQSA
jgi:uncharacterized membrane protein